ncbi:MAG: hypothetical protein IJR85_00715 [Synergistaceae bacterium]|nr:hypothetical protein [Synergistaceae bacterium]
MWKKVYSLVVTLTLCLCAGAFSAGKSENYTGPLLTACNIYQLGTDEFLISISGRKLPVPYAETDGNSLLLTFKGARAKNPELINESMESLLDGSPALYGFEIENLPDEQIVVRLYANSELFVHSSTRTAGGFTLRIRYSPQAVYDASDEPFPPLKSTVQTPTSSLPFSAETRTTIDFREAELQDVFRLFMAALGRNIVIDASFPRDVFVTMTLVDVRIDEIMNYLLRTYDLSCYNYGPNITAFGTREGLYKLSGASEFKMFKISYANPQRVSEILKNLLGFSVTLIKDDSTSGSDASTSSSTSTGSSESAQRVANTSRSTANATISEIMVDQRLRTLYVKTNPARMAEVEDLIKTLDVPLRQVMIRASIFEFNDTATLDVQNSLNMVYDRWNLLTNPGSSQGTLTYEDRTYRNGRSDFDRYVTSVFSALEMKNKGRTLANPSVITIEGEEAKITLKQNIMYSAGRDDSGNPTWSTTDVGPELTFTPTIEDKGYINLEISITTGDYLGKDTDGNIITTDRNVETHIRVRDGMPFVLGGLFQDATTRLRSKIPVLGDIPLLGNLFRLSSNEHNKSQAVMIVTPYILDSH